MSMPRKKIVKFGKKEQVLGLGQRRILAELRELFNQAPGPIKLFRVPLKKEKIIAIHYTITGHQLVYEME
jgi:hypothetical protein